EDAMPVADRRLENRAAAVLHAPFGDAAHLGDDRHGLVEAQLAERRQLTPARVPPRVVREQISDGAHAEGLLEHLRRAPAQRGCEPLVERGIHVPRVPSAADPRVARPAGLLTQRVRAANMRATATMSASACPDAAVAS